MIAKLDSNLQTLHKYARQFLSGDLPEFIKSADANADRETAQGLPKHMFADTTSRRFPIHTKSAAWVSCLYFLGDEANGLTWDSPTPRERVEGNLVKAAKIYGFTQELEALRSAVKQASAVPAALKAEDYALRENGDSVLRYPVVNEASTRKSAEMFFLNRDKYPLPWRRRTAFNILEKMAKFDVRPEAEITDYLVKAAGLYPKDTPAAILALAGRYILSEDGAQAMLRKVGHAIVVKGRRDFDQLAEAIDSYDTSARVDSYYGGAVLRPEEMLFDGVTAKEASGESTVTLTSGSTWRTSDIVKAGAAVFAPLDAAYRSCFGDGVTESKVAEIVPTMPRDDAQALEASLSAAGVKPCEAKEAKAQGAPAFGDVSKWMQFFKDNGLKAAPLSFALAFNPDFAGAVT